MFTWLQYHWVPLFVNLQPLRLPCQTCIHGSVSGRGKGSTGAPTKSVQTRGWREHFLWGFETPLSWLWALFQFIWCEASWISSRFQFGSDLRRQPVCLFKTQISAWMFTPIWSQGRSRMPCEPQVCPPRWRQGVKIWSAVTSTSESGKSLHRSPTSSFWGPEAHFPLTQSLSPERHLTSSFFSIFSWNLLSKHCRRSPTN